MKSKSFSTVLGASSLLKTPVTPKRQFEGMDWAVYDELCHSYGSNSHFKNWGGYISRLCVQTLRKNRSIRQFGSARLLQDEPSDAILEKRLHVLGVPEEQGHTNPSCSIVQIKVS